MDAKKIMNSTVLTFGALFAIITILYNIINYINPPTADPETSSKGLLDMIALAIFITIPILAIKYYTGKGIDVTLGKSVKIGVLVGLLGGFIAGIYGLIYYGYNPDAVDRVIEISKERMAQIDMFDADELEAQAETTKRMFLPMQVVGGASVGSLYGVIGGLLGGLFFKTPNEDY
jgi:membrane protease YdiL (CAAX protease family)